MHSEKNLKEPSKPTASAPDEKTGIPEKSEIQGWKRLVKNPWVRISVYLGLFILGGCMFADRAFYVPSENRPVPPKVSGYGIQERSIPIGEDALSVWVIEPEGQPVKGTALYSHGNAGNMGNHLGFADFLPLNGYRLVLYDYRGYGGSTGGPPTREKTITDAYAALDWTLENFGPTWMVGQSLGASLSIWVGGERSKEIEGVVAIAPFTSYRAIARDVLGRTIILYPVKWPMSLMVSSGGDPIDRVGSLSPKPLLLVHGEADDIIPDRMSDELFAAAGEPRVLKKIPMMGHNDGWRSADRSFSETILEFLEVHRTQ